MLVVFGCDFGQLIVPDLNMSKVPYDWDSIPIQADLLAASMPCIKQLAKRLKSQTRSGSFHLTSELVWHKPTGRSRTCNSYCDGSSCQRIQRVRQVGKSWRRNVDANPPGRLVDNQAIVFGDPEYYHQSLKLLSKVGLNGQGDETLADDETPVAIRTRSRSQTSNDLGSPSRTQPPAWPPDIHLRQIPKLPSGSATESSPSRASQASSPSKKKRHTVTLRTLDEYPIRVKQYQIIDDLPSDVHPIYKHIYGLVNGLPIIPRKWKVWSIFICTLAKILTSPEFLCKGP